MDVPRVWIAAIGLGTFLFARAVYRVFFHPLRKVPGPTFAAATYLYEFYYDVILGGRYIFQIEKLHQKYGPIIRISPHEVHVSDPEFYDQIYAHSSHRRDKDPWVVNGFTAPHSMVSTVGHDHHRFRRNILNSFFSKKRVLELESFVETKINHLMERFEEFHREDKVVQLDDAFAALTADVITYYSYGKNWGFLDDKTFRSDIRVAVNELTTVWHFARFFGWVISAILALPPSIMCWVMPAKAVVFNFQKSIFEHSADSMLPGLGKGVGRNIFSKLSDPSLPAAERSLARLQQEGLVVLMAGTETTGRVLSVGTFHLSQDKELREKMREELRQSGAKSWTELEKLPILTAFVNEALRVGIGLTSRLPRSAPTETLMYKDIAIAPGTSMSSSSYIIHRDPTLFPDPDRFYPQRWIEASERNFNLPKYLATFTRGSRACIGMNLAYMELYMTFAELVRRFDFEMYDTTYEDVRVIKDFAIGYTRRGDMKILAKVAKAY
ncbi:cytochrome P450 [Aspergillus candidus]|uniref:Cytochrome P450 n=1 Tax=Aspergillus candidus TaxID=41067 RepID=A0A2I2F3M5_ASPCN|nr:cytochrome P450 [Aspergillus candidus]PLB35237.1 cytochrome P450 [Aspergillus candidus]